MAFDDIVCPAGLLVNISVDKVIHMLNIKLLQAVREGRPTFWSPPNDFFDLFLLILSN
jgi:hypothetical protein